MIRDVRLAEVVLERIEADPVRWNQDTWAAKNECGTTHCFGGWTVALGRPDAEFLWRPAFDGPGDWVSAAEVRLPDGSVQSVGEVARELLGLTVEESNELFYGDAADTLDGLRRVVAELCGLAS